MEIVQDRGLRVTPGVHDVPDPEARVEEEGGQCLIHQGGHIQGPLSDRLQGHPGSRSLLRGRDQGQGQLQLKGQNPGPQGNQDLAVGDPGHILLEDPTIHLLEDHVPAILLAKSLDRSHDQNQGQDQSPGQSPGQGQDQAKVMEMIYNIRQ